MDLIERPAEFGPPAPLGGGPRPVLPAAARPARLCLDHRQLAGRRGRGCLVRRPAAGRPSAQAARLVCWDVHYGDAELATAAPDTAGIELTATRPRAGSRASLMLDVIEHVEDDVAFVTEVVRASLADTGWVLVSVPAYQSLFSDHDRALKHFRRYSPAALRRTLESAGLNVMARGGLFHALLPVRGRAGPARAHRPPPGVPKQASGDGTAPNGCHGRSTWRSSTRAGCRWPWRRGFTSLPRPQHVGAVPAHDTTATAMSGDAVPVIVVPCYNEERRLDEQVFVQVARTGQVRLLFVDDGSTDDTARILHRMAGRSEAIEVLRMGANAGKAEAVRQGLLVAVRGGATIVGYYDADLATPPDELARLIEALQEIRSSPVSSVAVWPDSGSSIGAARAPLPGPGLRHAGVHGARASRCTTRNVGPRSSG